MSAIQDYFDFVMEYAPYFYYIPSSGVDPEWGRGPAAAAHAIDFLYECYYDSRFTSEKTDIYNKIAALADYLLSIQCNNNAKEAYGGFQSKDESNFYYSIDAHRAIPTLLKAYDLAGTSGYLDAAKLAGGTFLYNMQHRPSVLGEHDKYYGGFAQWVDINDDWGPDMWIVDLYGLVELKQLYTRTEETKYQTILDDSLEFYREGIRDRWLYYKPPPSGDEKWHRAPGVPPENLIYEDLKPNSRF